jgi:DNA replication protein DnaC
MNSVSLTHKTGCETCRYTGWFTDEKGARPCNCTKTNRVSRLIEQACIPRRYRNCNFTQYQPQGEAKSKTYLSQIAARATSSAYIRQFPATSEDFQGLLFIGPCGVGKTHLATAILRSVIETHQCSGLFVDSRNFLLQLQSTYDPRATETPRDILTPLYEVELLVLDELGAAKPTPWAQDIFFTIINRRYIDEKPTIFTSNYTDTPSNKEESLTDRIGVRLRSRLYEMCQTVLIHGDDYRQRKQKQPILNNRHS